MCHAWVKRIIRWDKKGIFKFAPLEGDTAREVLASIMADYLSEDTIVYYDGSEVWLRSQAALKILSQLGFPYHLMALGWIIPIPWRDWLYRKIADNRYRYGERFAECPLPDEKQKGRFI